MVSEPKGLGAKPFSEPKAVTRRRKLRDDLIEAAERTIEAEGLPGLKARDLALRVGCAVGAIYNVFADLDDLVFAVNAVTLEQLEQTLTRAGHEGDDPHADAIRTLTHLGLAYTDYAAAHTRRWRALFDHRLPAERDVPAWYQANLHRLFDYIEQPLRKLAPALGTAPRALLARSLFSAVHGIVLIGLEEKLQSLPLSVLREQVTAMIEAFGRGLAVQGARG
jgi:AcrR family transcriptional regulator